MIEVFVATRLKVSSGGVSQGGRTFTFEVDYGIKNDTFPFTPDSAGSLTDVEIGYDDRASYLSVLKAAIVDQLNTTYSLSLTDTDIIWAITTLD